jgi:DNA-damage-inducible protein D
VKGIFFLTTKKINYQLKKIINPKNKIIMKENEIKELFEQFESIACEYGGVECWSARELQKLLGYSKWENFEKTIEKAKESCKNANISVLFNFPDVRKIVQTGLAVGKEIDDILLTRYACYLIARLQIFYQQ